jgi:type I restriction enzyme S subunit
MSRSIYKTELAKIANVVTGQSPESIHYSSSEGIPFLQGNRTFGTLYPSIDTYTKKVTKLSKKDDILMSVRAPVGDLNFAPCDLCIGRGLASISAKDGDNKFLYYALKYNIKNLIKQGNGTTFDAVNKDVINEFELIIPESTSERHIVGKALSFIDSKIELNIGINTELENLSKTLYDFWFVQFDFPDANGKPYNASGGKMIWNNELKRDIPEGWQVVKMSEWLEADKSGDWGKEEPAGNFTKKVTCIRGADINGLNGLTELKPPTRYILEKNSSKILKSHDLIIEISGGSPTQSTGRIAFITDATIKRFENPLICSNFCKPISIKNKKLLYNFVYYWNSLYDAGIFFGYEGKTSGIKNLLLDSFVSSFYTVVPDDTIIDQFYLIMDTIQEQKQTLLAQNQQLSSLRDWLLPMLMNGQVKVK